MLAIGFCVIFVLTLHIYLVYALKFLEEKKIREYKEKQALENPNGAKRVMPNFMPEPRRKASSHYDLYLIGV